VDLFGIKSRDSEIAHLRRQLTYANERANRLIEALAAKSGYPIIIPDMSPEPDVVPVAEVEYSSGQKKTITAADVAKAEESLWRYARGPSIASPVQVPAPDSKSKLKEESKQ